MIPTPDPLHVVVVGGPEAEEELLAIVLDDGEAVPLPDGTISPLDFWMSREQFAYWRHTHLTIDLVDGRGGGFSLETPDGKRFLTRSRMLTDDEVEHFGLLTPPAVA